MDYLQVSQWDESDVQRVLQGMDFEEVAIEICRTFKGSFQVLDKTDEERESGQVNTRQTHGYAEDRTRFVSRTEFNHYAVVKFKEADKPPIAAETNLATEIVYRFRKPAADDKLMAQRAIYAKVRGILDSWPQFRSYLSSCASLMGFNAPQLNPQTTLQAIRMAGFERAGTSAVDNRGE